MYDQGLSYQILDDLESEETSRQLNQREITDAAILP